MSTVPFAVNLVQLVLAFAIIFLVARGIFRAFIHMIARRGATHADATDSMSGSQVSGSSVEAGRIRFSQLSQSDLAANNNWFWRL